jgi:hypothetical protein
VGIEKLSLPECEFPTEIADCVIFVAEETGSVIHSIQ